jgi:uncharacterized MAPEG superfamily protein
MTVSLWCVLVAAVLPLVCTVVAKSGRKEFDNRSPREWLARQQGFRARANAAQQNSWEALAVFAAGVFTAHFAHAPQATLDALAVAFVITRLGYIACYLGDAATLRSIVWFLGFGLSVALFVIGA